MKFNKIFFIIDDYLSVAFKTYFSLFFCTNVLCSKVNLVFCLKHDFAIEQTLQENLVRTGEFGKKTVSIERIFCWR